MRGAHGWDSATARENPTERFTAIVGNPLRAMGGVALAVTRMLFHDRTHEGSSIPGSTSKGRSMARLRRFVAAGINLSLPEPHTPERYSELFVSIFRLRQPVRVRGDQQVMISALSHISSSTPYIEGVLARFTEIDPDLPWFNLDRLDEAEDEDRLSISIPQSLRPNYKPFLFHFDLQHHTFVFEQSYSQQSLSVWAVQRFLQASVRNEEISGKFGSVSVSMIQSEDALDAIFSLKEIRRLRILYRLPNPDDHSSLEEVMQKRLKAANGSQVDTIWDADARSGINPNDAELRELAQSALRNGLVQARGIDRHGQLVTASSEEHPKLASERFDPNGASETATLRRLARFFF